MPNSTLRLFSATFKRDLLLAFRYKGELINCLAFFLIATTLIPLALGPEKILLSRIAPGIIWVMALLATLLSLDAIFRSDFDDGTLEQMVIAPHSLLLTSVAKILAHWLSIGFPLAIFSPILGVTLSLPDHAFYILCCSLLIGTGIMSFVGAIASALTLSLRKGGLLIALLVMPLYVPVLIFGASAVDAAALGESAALQMSILGAGLCLSLLLAPWAIAAALKLNVNA